VGAPPAGTKYNVTLIDPAGYKFAYLLTDSCRLIAYGLRGLGYQADLTVNSLDPTAVNVIIGGHLLSGETARGIAGSGMRYVVFQSEWLSEGPDGKVHSSFQAANFEPNCRALFEGAAQVWEAYDHNRSLLERWDLAPGRLRTIGGVGFHPDMADVKHRPWAEKDVDVLFFGSVTPRRARVIDELSKTLRVLALLDAPAAFRNDLIARAKLNLNLHATDEYQHLSLARVSVLLNNRCVVVSEQANTHKELQALMATVEYGRLTGACRALLATQDLEAMAGASFAAYQQMPMSEVLRPLLVD
jgi:hypothetical protein